MYFFPNFEIEFSNNFRNRLLVLVNFFPLINELNYLLKNHLILFGKVPSGVKMLVKFNLLINAVTIDLLFPIIFSIANW